MIRTATTITREGLTETKELLGQLENTAKSVQENVAESVAVAADVLATGSGSSKDDANSTGAGSSDNGIPNPFNLDKD